MKKRWNPFKGLTKRQKRILLGSGAGILGILLIIIIIYLCSGGKKEQSDLVRRDALGDTIVDTSTRDSKAHGSSGKGLGAKVHLNNTPSESHSQDEIEENLDNNETLKTTEKEHHKLPAETPELVPQNTETKTPIAPKKESQKKQPATSLKTCAEYQGALAEALKKRAKRLI